MSDEPTGEQLAADGWRFRPGSGVRHVTRPVYFDDSVRRAPCGMYGGVYYWLGTGTQDEYERLADLSPCRKCERAG